MEILKYYILISLSVLYACYIIKNLIVLINNLKTYHYFAAIGLFIFVVLIPGIFELITTLHYINRHANNDKNGVVKVIKLDVSNSDNLDEELKKIKKIIEDDFNGNE